MRVHRKNTPRHRGGLPAAPSVTIPDLCAADERWKKKEGGGKVNVAEGSSAFAKQSVTEGRGGRDSRDRLFCLRAGRKEEREKKEKKIEQYSARDKRCTYQLFQSGWEGCMGQTTGKKRERCRRVEVPVERMKNHPTLFRLFRLIGRSDEGKKKRKGELMVPVVIVHYVSVRTSEEEECPHQPGSDRHGTRKEKREKKGLELSRPNSERGWNEGGQTFYCPIRIEDRRKGKTGPVSAHGPDPTREEQEIAGPFRHRWSGRGKGERKRKCKPTSTRPERK